MGKGKLRFVDVNYRKILAYGRRGEQCRPNKSIVFMEFCPMQKLEIITYYIGQYTNKEVNMLGPTMLDPTTVSHTFVMMLGNIFFLIFLYIK